MKISLIKNENKNLLKRVRLNYEFYLLFLPVLIYFAVFKYAPMYGILIAFKDFKASRGIMGSEWVGLYHFVKFFNAYEFKRVLTNTVGLGFYQLIAGFPAPLILAIIINELGKSKIKKFVQTVTYAPHFISVVVFVGMLKIVLSPNIGIINNIIVALGFESVHFMAKPSMFKTIYVVSNIWQNSGWGSIIYIAALASIDISQYESAYIDGCSRIKKIFYIDLPSIMPTIITLLILSVGRVMTLAFQKVLLMQNDLNIASSDIIQTYTYRVGIIGGQFSYTTAIGLFNNIINLILLISVNRISKKISENSLW